MRKAVHTIQDDVALGQSESLAIRSVNGHAIPRGADDVIIVAEVVDPQNQRATAIIGLGTIESVGRFARKERAKRLDLPTRRHRPDFGLLQRPAAGALSEELVHEGPLEFGGES